MGSRSSRNRRATVVPVIDSSNESPITRPVVPLLNYKKSVQTSTTNLRTQTPPVLSSTTQDTAVQTSTFRLRAPTIPTNDTNTKDPKEIRLRPDRTRTITEDHNKNPRKDLITNKEHRQHIDNNCTNVKSIAELVNKIGSYSDNDLVQAWLIFYWIAKHISYVTTGTDNAADAVFRTRNSTCRGFTNLFSECCRLLKIECVDVPGYVKETSFKIGDTLQQATYVWNAVNLSGRWYLVDAAWGAGINGGEKKREDVYFLTSPDQMIYTHLPTEDTWQLLSPPITKQAFLNLPLVKSNYYRLNLKLISPKQCVYMTSQLLFEVVIKAPFDVSLSTTMKVGDDECPDFHQLCQYDQTDGLTRCYFSPTNDGKKITLL